MPVQITYPGVYITEIPSGNSTITGVATSITAFVGRALTGPVNEPTTCFSFADFTNFFGGRAYDYPMSYAVEDFFLNGGSQAIIVRLESTQAAPVPASAPIGGLAPTDLIGDQNLRTGLYALDHVDLFNLLCIPWDQRGVDIDISVHAAAAQYCVTRRAMYIIDSLKSWADDAKKGEFSFTAADLGINDQASQCNSAVYFPKVSKSDPEMGGAIDIFPACGIIAGQIAATDAARGVWQAPAGLATSMAGITGLDVSLNDAQNDVLNPIGINCLRNFPRIGPVIWGSRTLCSADLLSDDYKYVPVRRLTLYIEESLYRGISFAVFEPNDKSLWSQLRLAVGAFMADLNRQGAFHSYTVACDETTTTQSDIDSGIVNIRVAFAPVIPDQFIVLQIQQLAGQSAS